MSKDLRVLLVEDSEDDAELLVIALERGGYQVISRRVDNRIDMQTALEESPPWDIILADYSMPQFNAIAALELLKKNQLDLPFVIVSGKIGEDTAVAAMKAGAHDYLVKENLSRLIPAVERELREAVFREEYRSAQRRLRRLAYYDKLTGLPNRTLFLEHLEREIAWNRESNSIAKDLFAVLLLSIDRFRSIKHSLGYLISRELSVAVARRLEECASSASFDTVAKINEDEFAILVTGIDSTQDVLQQAESLYRQLSEPFNISNTTICSTVSIGIALNQQGNQEPEKLLQWADTAMQDAKINFIKTSVLFDVKMQSQALQRLRLENDLQQAIERQQLYLNYQPIVSLDTGEILRN